MMTMRRWLVWGCLAAVGALFSGCGEGIAGSQREPRTPTGIRDSTQLADGANASSRAEGEDGPPPLPLIRDVVLQPNFAYVLVPDALVVVSLDDPAQPEIVGRLVLAKTPLRMTIAAGHAWIACDAGGLQVAGLSQPRNPQLVGAWAPEAGGVTRIATDGKVAVAAVPGRGVSVLDASDPAKPVELKSITFPEAIADVALQGDRAYALTDKVLLFDITKPAAAEKVGEYPLKQTLLAAAPVAEQTVLLTSQGLNLLNFRAPARPLPVSDVTFAAITKALTPEPEATPAEQPAADTTGGGDHGTAMMAAEEVDLSATPELAAQPDAPAGDHTTKSIKESAEEPAEEADEAEDTEAPKPHAEARLRVAGGTILAISDGQVTLLEVREQKSIVPLWRAAGVTNPSAADQLAKLLAVAQGDGLLKFWKSADGAWTALGSLKLNDQVSTESLPGTEPLPVSEGAKNAMQGMPKPSSERPAGAPGPA